MYILYVILESTITGHYKTWMDWTVDSMKGSLDEENVLRDGFSCSPITTVQTLEPAVNSGP